MCRHVSIYDIPLPLEMLKYANGIFRSSLPPFDLFSRVVRTSFFSYSIKIAELYTNISYLSGSHGTLCSSFLFFLNRVTPYCDDVFLPC